MDNLDSSARRNSSIRQPSTLKSPRISVAFRSISHLTGNTEGSSFRETIRDDYVDLNEVMLQQAVAAAGTWAYGVKAVEVWLYDDNDEGGRLRCLDGGIWIDPVFPKTTALSQLVDPSVQGYLPTKRLVSGEGMAGVLWAESYTLSSLGNNIPRGAARRSRNRYSSYAGRALRGSIFHSLTTKNDQQDTLAAAVKAADEVTRAHNAEEGKDNGPNQNKNNTYGATWDEEVGAGGAPRDGTADDAGGIASKIAFTRHSRKVVWRNLNTLANDPFQPPNRRLKLWVEAGFGLAAGVVFEARAPPHTSLTGNKTAPTTSIRGLVIFMARDTVDLHRLKSPDNEAYMMSAADLIGAELALAPARSLAVRQRQEERAALLRRVKLKLRAVATISKLSSKSVADQLGLNKDFEDNTSPCSKQGRHGKRRVSIGDSDSSGQENVKSLSVLAIICIAFVDMIEGIYDIVKQVKIEFVALMKKVAVKSKGGGPAIQPPPPMPNQFAWATFGGVLTTLSLICGLSQVAKVMSNGTYQIVLGPFGALMTLQFGLMAAPVAQPRNALYGQLFSMVVALLVSYLPQVRGLSVWFYPALATAIAVGGMARLGIIHPPGGASALLFSSGKFGWIHIGLMLMANVVAIICATLYNNMLDKRKYPIYWSLDHGVPVLEKYSYCGLIPSRQIHDSKAIDKDDKTKVEIRK